MQRIAPILYIAILWASALGAGENFIPGLIATYSDGKNTLTQIAPLPNFVLTDKQSIHPSLTPQFKAEWKGAIKILRRGTYQFGGDAAISVDGKAAQGQPLDLTPGVYPLQLSYERKPGPARLQFTWQSNFFKAEPVPSHVLGHATTPAEIAVNAQIEHGRLLAEELNCIGCHATQNQQLAGRTGPELSNIGARATAQWLYKWFENPRLFNSHAAMPAVLNDDERRHVATYLSLLKGGTAPKEKATNTERIANGKKLFGQVGCIACHADNTLPLKGLGSKYIGAAALAGYLLDPLTIDPSGRMPALFDPKKDEEAAWQIGEYLLQDKRAEYAQDFEAGDVAKGEELIRSRGCQNCHTINPDMETRLKALKVTLQDLGLKEQSAWKWIGPFNSKGNPRVVFPPEEKLDFAAEYTSGDNKLMWQDGKHFADNTINTLVDNKPNSIVYLHRTIEMTKDSEASLALRSDDTLTIWLNGEKVYEFLQPRSALTMKDNAPIKLKAGSNTLLMKVGNMGGAFEFYYRLEFPLQPMTNTLKAPAFEKLSGDKGCLADTPQSPAPRYGLTAMERESLRAFIKFNLQAPEISEAPVHALYHTVAKLRCTACHELHAKPPAIALAESAPVMTLFGDKLRQSWLDEVLVKDARSRIWLHLRMPEFGKAAMSKLPEQFAAMAGVAPNSDAAPPQPSLEQIRTGVKLIGKDAHGGYACFACHDYLDHKATGDIRGIDMTAIASRIRGDWFRRWMRDPIRIQPGTAMPQIFSGMDEQQAEGQMDLLWSTLSLGRSLPMPPGLDGQKSLVLTVKDEPVFVRGFMPGSSTRSITVGLPNYISYVFDAENCRLRYAWFGGFLDMQREWTNRGGGPPQPLGTRFYTAPDFFPLRVGKPDDDSKPKFLGYTLVKNLPEFEYEVAGVKIKQTITSLPNSLGLVMAFEAASGGKDVYFIKNADKGVTYTSSVGAFDGDALKLPAGQPARFTITISVDERK